VIEYSNHTAGFVDNTLGRISRVPVRSAEGYRGPITYLLKSRELRSEKKAEIHSRDTYVSRAYFSRYICISSVLLEMCISDKFLESVSQK